LSSICEQFAKQTLGKNYLRLDLGYVLQSTIVQAMSHKTYFDSCGIFFRCKYSLWRCGRKGLKRELTLHLCTCNQALKNYNVFNKNVNLYGVEAVEDIRMGVEISNDSTDES
jgi:hypothetical protein